MGNCVQGVATAAKTEIAAQAATSNSVVTGNANIQIVQRMSFTTLTLTEFSDAQQTLNCAMGVYLTIAGVQCNFDTGASVTSTAARRAAVVTFTSQVPAAKATAANSAATSTSAANGFAAAVNTAKSARGTTFTLGNVNAASPTVSTSGSVDTSNRRRSVVSGNAPIQIVQKMTFSDMSVTQFNVAATKATIECAMGITLTIASNACVYDTGASVSGVAARRAVTVTFTSQVPAAKSAAANTAATTLASDISAFTTAVAAAKTSQGTTFTLGTVTAMAPTVSAAPTTASSAGSTSVCMFTLMAAAVAALKLQ